MVEFHLQELEGFKENTEPKMELGFIRLGPQCVGVDFNPKHEPITIQHIWVIILGLPVPFWRKSILEFIGNKIGMFLSLEEGWDPKPNRRWDRLQVEVDLHES